MNKRGITILAVLLIIFSISLSAQKQHFIQCKMTVEEIMNTQSIDIDLPEYKKARAISETLINSFEIFYGDINDNDTTSAQKQKEIILSALESAEIIKMDYSMFNEDIDFLKSYDLK